MIYFNASQSPDRSPTTEEPQFLDPTYIQRVQSQKIRSFQLLDSTLDLIETPRNEPSPLDNLGYFKRIFNVLNCMNFQGILEP